MRRLLVIATLLLSGVMGNAQQRQGGVWIFGKKYKLDFNAQMLKVDTINLFYFDPLTSANTCDSNGNLNFLISRDTCYTRNFRPMANGVIRLGGINDSKININSESYFTIQKSNRIFIFHLANGAISELPGEFYPYFFIVDLSLNQGFGDLVLSPRKYYFSPIRLEGLMTPMLHENGQDYWIVARKYRSDTLVSWLFQEQGWGQPVFSKINSRAHLLTPNSFSDAMTLKSSPNSEYLYHPWLHRNYNRHELIRFDRSTGKALGTILLPDSFATNQIPTPFTNFMRDAAFSPDSRLLYLFTTHQQFPEKWPKFVHQYDISVWDSVAINQSKIRVGVVNTQVVPLGGRLAGQLAIDGKIYISNGDADTASSFNIIHCPNTRGLGCNFQVKGLRFPKVAFMTGPRRLPTLNQTIVRNAGIFQVQANKRKICKGDTLEISGYGAGAERFTWSVSPALPPTVKVDTLTWQKIATQNIPAGVYTFRCRASSRCGDVFEKSLQVEILPLPPKPNLVLVQKPVPCKGDSVVIAVQNPQSGNRYFWSTGDSTSSIVVKQTGLFSLDSVSNTVGCGIRVGDTVAVNIKNAVIPPVPQILGPKLVEVCEGQKAKLTIDNGQLTIQYGWSNGVVGDSVFVGGGQYSVISESAEGCQSGSSDTVYVNEIPLPKPVFINLDSVLTSESMVNQNYCLAGLPGSRFSFVVTGGQKIDSSENCITISWTPLSIINYQLSITETLQNPPCAGTRSQIFTYRPTIEIPNLITPNGDGKNETFLIQDLEFYPNHRLQIFNRWGKKVLDTTAYKNDWQGEDGIYFYQLTVDSLVFKGWITVNI